MKMDSKNVLVIGDTHAPAIKDGYLHHCARIRDKYGCGTIVHVGDLVDLHAHSYHEHEPQASSSEEELSSAQKVLKEWAKEFPKIKISYGNHDLLIYRKGKTIGLSETLFRSMNEILKTPNTWEWAKEWMIDDVLYLHGTGFSGPNAHITAMKEHRRNVVIGHNHSVCGVSYSATKRDLLFGMSVGAGVNDSSLVFNYGENCPKKSVISCGVVLYGHPILEPMNLGVKK